VAEKYPYPPDFASFSYASALAAANKVGAFIRDARLGEGKAGRAVFSRLSDSELKISSSAIDHRGRWKPLQYYSKRFFAPVRLYAVANSSDVRFYAVNGKKSLLSAVMEYKIIDRDNRVIYDGARQVELSAMSADSLFTIDFSEYVEGHESEYCLEYCLREGTTLLSRDVLLFVPEKHFDFKKPSIKSVINGEGKKFSITLAADCFVKDLEIDFDGVDIRLSDNYLDLTSDAPVRVEFTVLDSAYNTQNLKDALILRSVSDLR
jgi:beta-mannosidase